MLNEARFWANVVVTEGGCWERPIGADKDGYARVKVAGRTRRAHRVAYELRFGPIPDDLLVMHACDNPPCINPDHLALGTHADNHADRNAKGRQARHERNGNARLNMAIAREMRTLRNDAGWTCQEIADMYGVCDATVWNIVNGCYWQERVR